MFKPRPKQEEILKYESGRMGVPAVPGSGKTHTLSYLASLLIVKGLIEDEQEILIVTLVNSAVDNFTTRISRFVQQAGLLQKIGYRVRTLHGLAHDIIRERPDLAGVSEQFSILDENETGMLIEQISTAYVRDHTELMNEYLDPSIDLQRETYVQKQWYSLIADISTSFIQQAKDLQIDPSQLKGLKDKYQLDHPLFNLGLEVYTEYQRGLRFRSALDFSDLTRCALRALESDPDFRSRLQKRWPYILEDEAQDSSAIQEKILRNLVGENGNWVRVGDTNQAIYDTFTTASPEFLTNYLEEKNVTTKELPNSGRSNQSIIDLANYLIEWTRNNHPVESLRKSLTEPLILPAPEDDPQPNPVDQLSSIYINKQALKPEDEIKVVVRSIQKWLPGNTDKTVAILCPIGFYAEQVVEALQEAGVEVVELLQSTDRTRRATRLLEKCLASISDPSNVSKFCAALELFMLFDEEKNSEDQNHSALLTRLRKIRFLEELLYPQPDSKTEEISIIEAKNQKVISFIDFVRRWQSAAALPIDQLVILIGDDLFTTPQDLALTHKISLLLEFSSQNHPDYRLPQFIEELTEISHNERKFIGFSEDDSGFNPETHKGKVLVTTYHKSKGLEWDRVYLMSVNNYDFPSLQEDDQYKGEKWFIKGNLNLQTELIAMLKGLVQGNLAVFENPLGAATLQSREEYAAERIRLLFVGITRARTSLIITWNTGKRNNCTMSLPLQALTDYLEKTRDAA